jgi:cell division protein FtsB
VCEPLSPGLLSPSASGDFGLGLGVIVPGPRNPSPTREIQGLKSRNSVLEATNSRLEAELRQARSNPGLRASVAASMYSISSLAVRDDMSIGWTSHNGSCLDLAMPALVAEIDQLKRSGAALQAELQGLKSQVSLLLPPTPHELAETEMRDGYVHGEKYVPSAGYAPPPGRVQELASDADDERDETPTPRRQDSLSSDIETAESYSSAYSTSSADSASPLTPDTSTDWPALPNITELTLGKAGDRSSVISLTRGGAPLTKLPPRGHARQRSRIAPVNVTQANACVPGSDPTTPKATTPKARRAQRNSLQPTPRSAVTPRTSMFNMGTAVPPPRPPRRRPVAVPREIVEVAAA